MAFKIPATQRNIGVSGNFGTLEWPVPEANGDAAVFRYHSASNTGTPSTYEILGRRLTFTRLNLTGVSSINVSIMLATPSNPLGANEMPTPHPWNPGAIRVFGSPLDVVNSNTAPYPAADLHADRMRAAKIYYTIEDGINQNLSIPVTTGTIINTSALVSYNTSPTPSLSPTSPLRTFSPYNITVPPSLQKSDVTLHIFQGFVSPTQFSPVTPGSPSPAPGYPFSAVWSGREPSPVFTAASRFANAYTTGYAWAVNSIDLGANNGGVYRFTKTSTYADIGDQPAPATSSPGPDATYLSTVVIPNGISVAPNIPGSNAFFDTKAIVINPGGAFRSYDGTSANVTGLVASDKVAFTNTSVRINSFNALNSLDFQASVSAMPFRGTTGYVGKTFVPNVTAPPGTSYAFATKFNYASETWQVAKAYNATTPATTAIRINAGPAFGRSSLRNWFVPSPSYALTSTTTPTTAGGNFYLYFTTWSEGKSYEKATFNDVGMYGHSSTFGYHAMNSGYHGGEPVPAITTEQTNAGTPAPEIPYYGPLPAANRIRGSIVRFPFANFTDLNEVGETSPAAWVLSTWSGPSNMYFYGGVGQPGFAPAAIPAFNMFNFGFAATSLTNSWKFPFASSNLITPGIVSLTATGAGQAMHQASAATDHAGAWIVGGAYYQATSPATANTDPFVGTATSAATDTLVIKAQTGQAADPFFSLGAKTGFTRSANRRVQRFPWASETFTNVGNLGNGSTGSPVYVENVEMAGSETAAYVTGIFYSVTSPTLSGLDGGDSIVATYVMKFPFAATTAVTPSVIPTVGNRGGFYDFDRGISNQQSPESSYTLSFKFPFSSETQVGIVKELSAKSMETPIFNNIYSVGALVSTSAPFFTPVVGGQQSGAMNF
jgi:hypothetical protein